MKEYKDNDDFVFDNFVLRIKNYRYAISFLKESDELSPLYVLRIYVNLANVYNENRLDPTEIGT